jgi:hypothetical protein
MKSIALRIYRRLAFAFPHEFQIVYGADVIHLGEDAIDDVWAQQGFWGLIRLVADIAVRLPVEYLAEMRGDLAYAVRRLKKSRGFTAVGILSLGIGIGIATFSASELVPGAQEIGLAQAPPFSPLKADSTMAASSDTGTQEQVIQKVAKQTIGARYFASLSVNMQPRLENASPAASTEPLLACRASFPYLEDMEVNFSPETEKRLKDLAAQSGCGTADELVQDVVEGYIDELVRTRDTLNGRYDDLKSGTVKPIPGVEVEAHFREKSPAVPRRGS